MIDTAEFDIEQGKITEFVKLESGNCCNNFLIYNQWPYRERLIDRFGVVHVRDSLDRTFASGYSVILLINLRKHTNIFKDGRYDNFGLITVTEQLKY